MAYKEVHTQAFLDDVKDAKKDKVYKDHQPSEESESPCSRHHGPISIHHIIILD